MCEIEDLNNKTDLICKIQKEILEIYCSEKINMIRNRKKNISTDNIISEMHKYKREQNINLGNFCFTACKNDISFTSDELAYYTANAYLYKDTINNPVKDADSYYDPKEEKKVTYYPYLENISTKRYIMFIACAFEKLYNFWDRLGNLLWASYFQQDLRENLVNFSKVIDLVGKETQYNTLDSFKWLLKFKEDECNGYRKLNKIRKKIVHYSSISEEFKGKYFGTFENSEGKMQKKKFE